jgi:hypothetical protein
MIKTLAIIFGCVFLLAGVLGFVPAITPDEHLLGLHLNSAHNLVHILTGIAALIAGLASHPQRGVSSKSSEWFMVWWPFLGLSTAKGPSSGLSPITSQTPTFIR